MKKWILNLGLTAVAILPIVAVASCSSTTTESPSLTTEVAKYKTPFTVKDSSKTMKPEEVAKSINDATSAQKLTKLQTFVTLQLNTNNFTYEVGEAKAGANNTVDVSFKIAERADSTKNQAITLVINGFTTSQSAIEAEAAKFQTSVAAKEEVGTTRQVITMINETSTTQETKLTTLNSITTLPKLSEGFKMEIGLASQATVSTSIEVALTISQEGTSNKANSTLTITGLTAETVEQEIERLVGTNLVNHTVLDGKKGETAAEAATAITSIESLAPYYILNTLPSELKYNYTSDQASGDTVKVTLSISLKDGEKAMSKEITISGFKSAALADLEAEANSKLGDRKVLESKKNETAAQAQAAIVSDTALNTYYQQTTLAVGKYGYNFGGKSEVDKKDPTILNVTLKVRQFNVNPNLVIYKVVRISGFKALTSLETEAQKFAISLPANAPQTTTAAAITAINSTNTTQETKLSALKALVTGFPDTAGYTIEIKTAKVDESNPTSVIVPMTIAKTAPTGKASENAEANGPVLVNFIITGLTIPTQS